MKRTITYDQTIDIGYIYLIPPRIGTIKETIELDVNECVNVDIDKEGPSGWAGVICRRSQGVEAHTRL
ncbi:DUF2283 domain-containing protein [Bacillus altitudinis]|uniref:DUF2283 domain-containing protein n=1 Tax=Bacillus altitudinis TaxID=293387 RepID=UPI003D9AA549